MALLALSDVLTIPAFPGLEQPFAILRIADCREGVDDFDQALQGLLAIMERQQTYVCQHTLLLAKALEWERQQKQSRYLLVGEERQQAEAWLKVRFKDEQPPCLPTDLHCEFITESTKNGQNLMTQVFLSYAEVEIAIMEQVRRSLRREGFTVWTNRTDIQTGVDFQEAINRGMEEADNVVYLISPASLQSAYCQQEIDYALKLNKRIIPLLVKPTNLEEMPASLRGLQYIDLTDNTVDLDYQQDESQLLRVLRQDAAYYEEHKVLLTKALKWERQQRNPSILLRGYNLQHAEAWLKVGKQRSLHPPLPLQEEFITASLQQPPGISLDVFVSYSRADSDFARKLNDALQMQGKTTWFDQESIASGSDFQQEIYRGIENSNHFLFLISSNSINSPYCADEVEYAQKLNKRIVTILHRPVNPAEMHPVLAAVQWIDFNQREGDFTANFKELLRTIDTDPVHLQTHTRLLVRAIEWDEKGRKESLLLREDELASAEQWLLQSAGKEPKPTELQHAYIANSRSVEDANYQAAEILRAAAAKGKRLVTLGAISGGVGLLVAGIAGFLAWQSAIQIKVANVRLQTVASNEQFLSGQPFQALLTALTAGQSLRTEFKAGSAGWNDLLPHITGALQQTTNGISEKNTLSGHEAAILSISYSPNGKTIASGSVDKTIKLWDLATGKLLNTLKGHEGAVNSIRYSPDGRTIASASDDKTVNLWDATTGKLLHTLKGHQGAVSSINFSPDGKTIASASWDNTIKLWDAATGRLLRTLTRYQGAVFSISFTPDSKMIASGGDGKTINLWNAATGRLLRTLKGHQDAVDSISFTPDGKTIASASADNTVNLWDAATGRLLRTLKGHQGRVFSIGFSPDGKTIASASADNTINIWDAATGELLRTLKGHQGAVNSIDFSPDGKTIASGSDDNTIKLWQVATNSSFLSLEGHQSIVNNIRYSPDGRMIASASDDKTINLWDAATGKLLRTLKGHQAAVDSINFSPSGKTIASGSWDKTIKLWDAATGKLLRTLEGHQGAVESISFSPDGKMLASGSDDKTINLWDAATGKLLHTLKGYQQSVDSISFSPDGKTIASGSFDKTIMLWDVATGNLLHTFKGHQERVTSISFSPDGRTISSGSADQTIRIWDWDFEHLMTMGCDWISQYLISHPSNHHLCDANSLTAHQPR